MSCYVTLTEHDKLKEGKKPKIIVLSKGGGEMGSMYILSYQVRWYIRLYISLWYMQVPWNVQASLNKPRYVHIPSSMNVVCARYVS